jgi:hypothetical protein
MYRHFLAACWASCLCGMIGCFSSIDLISGIACETDDNCPVDATCGPTGECLAAGTEAPVVSCTVHSDCRTNNLCSPSDGRCVAGTRDLAATSCIQDADCWTNEQCGPDLHCIEGARSSCDNYECSLLGTTTICIPEEQTCKAISCVNDFGCDTTMICDNYTCQTGSREAPIALGERCTSDDECEDGTQCMYLSNAWGNNFCSKICNGNHPYEGCSANTYCGPFSSICEPLGPNNNGAPCNDNSECLGGACVAMDGAPFCSQWCDMPIDCPEGWSCADISGLPSGITIGACYKLPEESGT